MSTAVSAGAQLREDARECFMLWWTFAKFSTELKAKSRGIMVAVAK